MFAQETNKLEKGLSYFSTEMSQQVMLYNFLILNDSRCQFYYRDNICIRPYKKSGRGDINTIFFQNCDEVELQLGDVQTQSQSRPIQNERKRVK